MQFIRGLHNLKSFTDSSVITLGNFDGIHLGHQNLLLKLKEQAKALNAASVVITFEPHPKEFFAKQQLVPRLMRFAEKYLTIKQFGIDYLCCFYFNESLAHLSATEFVENILIKKMAMKAIVTGHDFHFGAKRQGNFALLSQLAQQHHFTAIEIPPVCFDHLTISSTRIREALNQGDLALATKLLGSPFSMCGKVAYGQQRGRDLGFPTANINLHRQLVPISGVFVVQAKLKGRTYSGVANVGTRPTFEGHRVVLEVHLFDFNEMIYGCNLEVLFLHKLRNEERFSSFDALLAQIKKDVVQARAYHQQ